MNSILLSNSLLKKKAENDENLRKALYYAYYKRRGYGDHIEELPLEDFESFLSFEDGSLTDDDNSGISNRPNFSDMENTQNNKIAPNKRKRYVRDGTILKLIPLDLVPLYRMNSLIKYVRIFDFNFPVDSKIFQDRCAKGSEYFKWSIDISEYKRVVATKYQKGDDSFSVDIEEKKNFDGNNFNQRSPQVRYYFDWILSLGNKEGLLLINSIKHLANHIKQKSKAVFKLEQVPEFVSKKEHYYKQIDTTTKNWIKSQPYFMKVFSVDQNDQDLTMKVIEEHYSMKYLESFGLNISKKDEIHSSLKSFKVSTNVVTNDFLGSFSHHEILTNKENNPAYDQYRECGIEIPHVILQNGSIVLKNIVTGEDSYKGQYDCWFENWIDIQFRKFLKYYVVFIISEKCQQYF